MFDNPKNRQAAAQALRKAAKNQQAPAQLRQRARKLAHNLETLDRKEAPAAPLPTKK